MTAYRGRVYFAAYDPAHGRDLWSTDGTAAGTRLELELNPGTADARFGGLRVLGDRLLFLADPPMYGRELYQLDVNPAGAVTGYHVVSDANTLGASPDMSRAFGVTVGGRMFFVADDNLSGTGPELWVTDGTQAGTRLVEDVRPGPLGGTSLLVAYGDRLYFRGTESNAPASDGLWSSDGTAAGTRRVGTLGTVTSITPVGTKLFVGTSSQGLWVLDAPGAEPREVFSHAGGRFTSPQAPADVNGVLFFGARDGFNTGQVWRSDGTDAGSFPVGDFAQPTIDLSAGVAAAGK
jgi:ELWxxDGT repeat protein